MEVYLSFGSNIGDRQLTIISGIEELRKNSKVYDLKMSRFYLTEPHGLTGQINFINCAVRLETTLSVRDILTQIHKIEDIFGRTREVRWGARTLDIDILFFGSQIIQEPDLIVPHPRIHQRAFVLQPLAELCPDLIHPVLHKSIKCLLENLEEKTTILYE